MNQGRYISEKPNTQRGKVCKHIKQPKNEGADDLRHETKGRTQQMIVWWGQRSQRSRLWEETQTWLPFKVAMGIDVWGLNEDISHMTPIYPKDDPSQSEEAE